MACRLNEYRFSGLSLVNDVFIETGTFLGETLGYALKAGYNQLHSTEVCKKNYDHSMEVFINETKVNIHFGSSPDVLPKIIDEKRATTFWLDAHYQGRENLGEKDPKYGECPLLEELKIIFSFKWKIFPYVLIDDAIMYIDENQFKNGLFKKEEWPSLEQIKNILPQNYETQIDNGIIYCLPKRNNDMGQTTDSNC